MAGSVNKVCASCGGKFTRKQRLSDSQWARKMFCSRSCAATKRKISACKMKHLYENGLSGSELAKLAGVSSVAVITALKKEGATIRPLSEAMTLSHNKPGMAEKFSELATGRKHSEETKSKLGSIVGPDHPLWRGGLTVSSGGYLQFTASKANGAHAGKLLHQVICEWKEGRPIPDGHHVHHLDGNKLNNHPENLVSMSAADHARLHLEERVN